LGPGDVEPFYSPDGQTVYFSSDRDYAQYWVIYSAPQGARESTANPVTELSAVSGDEDHNDYAPSVAPDGHTVVFNRDNRYVDTLWAPAGPSSVCTLYTPPDGLATAAIDGSGSRVVFNPVDPSEFVYVSGDNDLHLVTGVPFQAGSNPCDQQATLTDINLSAEAFLPGSQYATGDDANPDWSPNGQSIVFDSTRGGGDTLFFMNMTATPPTAYPLWPSSSPARETLSTEPVFSPSGDAIAFVEANRGTKIYDQTLVSGVDGQWQASGAPTDLSLQTCNASSFDSDPAWQPIPEVPPVLPEFPYPAALPGAALLVGGVWFALRAKRARRFATA
jgi:Tol biopolymer transport system component